MSGVILLLIAALIVCDFTVLFVGVIALGVTLVFVIWIYVGCRKTDLLVTHERFEVRYWFMKLSFPPRIKCGINSGGAW